MRRKRTHNIQDSWTRTPEKPLPLRIPSPVREPVIAAESDENELYREKPVYCGMKTNGGGRGNDLFPSSFRDTSPL
jgi:hypothetical protein